MAVGPTGLIHPALRVSLATWDSLAESRVNQTCRTIYYHSSFRFVSREKGDMEAKQERLFPLCDYFSVYY